jgi:hypothetical protein
MGLLEMRIAVVTVDPYLDTPVVVLEERDGRARSVPIWIGQAEAIAIVAAVQGIKMARPMTHDLLRDALGAVGATVLSVDVVDLREGTYYATVRLRTATGEIELDARPSDAIALALRTAAPIRVEEKVVERAATVQIDRPAPLAIAGDVSPDLLESLRDEAFPKWKM